MNITETGAARLRLLFTQLESRGGRALVAFLTALDPDPDTSIRLFDGVLTAGADLLEVGLPAADPHLDGPSIRRAHHRALAGCGGQVPSLDRVAGFLAKLAGLSPAPLLLMGYAGALAAQGGLLALLDRLPPHRVGAVMLPDLGPAGAADLQPELARRGVHLVRFVDPTMPVAELPPAVAAADGLIYARTYRGATGAGDGMPGPALTALRAAVRTLDPTLRVLAGFGINSPDRVRTVCQAGYDGAVVGTALVSMVEAGDHGALYRLIREMKAATREG